MVWFPGANVVHLGGCFFNGNYPVIDVGAGGSLEGMIAATDRQLPMMNEGTRLIPGHALFRLPAKIEQARPPNQGLAEPKPPWWLKNR